MMDTPTWRITIPKPIHLHHETDAAYFLEGDGDPPVAVLLTPPVTPPVDPPAKPVDPVKPPVDTSIFVFPPQPPRGADDPAQRSQILWTTPEGDHFYAVLPEFRNPLPGSHLSAGALPRTQWPGFVVTAGSNLWVPAYAGERYPGEIRRLLRGEVL